jgi:hypothetical protein
MELVMVRAAREAALEARYREQMELRLGLMRSDSEGVLMCFFFLRRALNRGSAALDAACMWHPPRRRAAAGTGKLAAGAPWGARRNS